MQQAVLFGASAAVADAVLGSIEREAQVSDAELLGSVECEPQAHEGRVGDESEDTGDTSSLDWQWNAVPDAGLTAIGQTGCPWSVVIALQKCPRDDTGVGYSPGLGPAPSANELPIESPRVSWRPV